MSEKVGSPGAYLKERIAQKTQGVEARRDDPCLVSIWPEAVKEVLAKFPNLSSEQRAALRASVEDQVKWHCLRTGQALNLFTPAFQEVDRMLA